MTGTPLTPWWESRLVNDHCSYSRTESFSCRTAFDSEAGEKPIRRCERIKSLLRHCPGRPTEIVESTSEVTEEEETSSRLRPNPGMAPPLPSLPSLPALPNFLPRAPEGPSGEERVDSFFQDIFKAADELLGQFGNRIEESADEALKGLFPRAEEGGPGRDVGGSCGNGDANQLNGWKKFLGLDKHAGGKENDPAGMEVSKGEPEKKPDHYKGFEQKFEEV